MFCDPEEMKTRCSNFNWCVDNDFQVYIRPVEWISNGRGGYYGGKECQIHIRKGGITTEGKEYVWKDGVKFYSKVTVGNKVYGSHVEAAEACWDVYAKLRERYG